MFVRIRLVTLGQPQCYADDTLIPLSADGLDFALLVFLGVERHASRRSLAALFRPDLDEESAARALAEALSRLRRSIGSSWLSEHTDTIAVTDAITVDALEFEQLVSAGENNRALGLYRDDFLIGLRAPVSPAYKAWVEGRRQQLLQTFHDAALLHSASVATRDSAGRGFFSELKRRRVTRMAAWYVASALVVIQFVQAMQDAFYLPLWLLTVAVLMAIIGLPLALLLSWQFDLTPEGILRTGAAMPASGPRRRTDWRVVVGSLTIILTSAALAFSSSGVRNLLAVNRTPALVCTDGSNAPCRSDMPIEPNRFAVLPLSHDRGVEPGLLDGEICARLLSEGLSHWRDINVADQLRLNEALARLPKEVRLHIPVDTGVAIARAVGAGKLIMGELWHFGDSTRVQAFLYDVTNGKLLNKTHTSFRSGTIGAGVEFSRLVQNLVLTNGEFDIPAPAAIATSSFAAVMAYDSAWKAIGAWQLDDAKGFLRTALRRDPNYSYAHLWLANVMMWQGDTTPDWRFHADRAAAAAAALGPADQLLARGVAELSARHYDAACDAFRALVRRDSANFHAWYGLGECVAANNKVVPDKRSRSGWSFASSYEEAIRAHSHALDLVPSFNASFINLGSSRLASLLFLSNAKYRSGFGAGTESMRFAARPELFGDTVRFVPYPYAEWTRQPVPPTNAALIARHRNILRAAAETWASAFPYNTQALEALAGSLEQSGDIDESSTLGNSAIEVVRRARKLEPDAARRLRFAMTEVRFLVKVERFREARRLAARTLEKHGSLDPADARRLAGLAGLTGRPREMAGLLVQGAADFDYDRPPSGEDVEVPLDLARAASALLAYAYFGGPADSLKAMSVRAHQILDSETDGERRRLLHAATLDRAARLTFPVLGADDAHRSTTPIVPLMEMQRMLWRGNTDGLKEALAELDRSQFGTKPTDMAADGILTEVQLFLAVRDTVRATRLLDRYLNDLKGVPSSHFRQPYQPVSIVRLMALRAELAERRQDRDVARKWARAVVDLWRKGDTQLDPTLRHMRWLARFW